MIARYHSDGTLDTSFGGLGEAPPGITIVDFQLTSDAPVGLAILEDGKIMVANFSHDHGLVFMRLHNDGKLDYSFGTSGKKVTNQIDYTDYLQGLEIIDGKMVVWGSASVARFEIDGSYDTSFGENGRTMFESEFGLHLMVVSAAFVDGDMIFGGGLDPEDILGGVPEARIVCVKQNGKKRNSFGTNGVITPGGLKGISGLVVNNQMITGAFKKKVARMDMDGNFDTTFGNNGIVELFEVDDALVANGMPIYKQGVTTGEIILQPNGLTTVAMRFTGGVGGEFAVARLLNDGSLDTTFGNESGWLRITGLGQRAFVAKLIGYANGKVLITGTYKLAFGDDSWNVLTVRTEAFGDGQNFGGGSDEFVIEDDSNPTHGNPIWNGQAWKSAN